MKRLLLLCLCAVLFLSACTATDEPSALPPSTTSVVTTASATVSTQTTTSAVVPVAPAHSPFYVEGVSVDNMICYFNEVCLDAEYVHDGDPTVVQKWAIPIRYTIHGEATAQDREVITAFAEWLNTVDGFPDISETTAGNAPNLHIYFCEQQEMPGVLGDGFDDLDGGVTFWYDENDQIYSGTICCRTDLSQHVRNSVILEELYNGLGPVQDTQLRGDSLIYAEYAEPQALTDVDECILRLLYHPSRVCGMNAAQCEAVIRELYY